MSTQQTARIVASAPLDLTRHLNTVALTTSERTLYERTIEHLELRVQVRDQELTRLRREVAVLRRDRPAWYETLAATVAALWDRDSVSVVAAFVVVAALVGAFIVAGVR